MLGENIKALRSKKGYTQKELADMLHVTAQAVSRWENGDVEPSIGTIRDMAKIFGVSADALISDDLYAQEVAVSQPLPDEDALADKVVEKVVEKVREEKRNEKPVLAVCEQCNRPIYNGNEIVRKTHYYGRTRKDLVICSDCDKKNKIRAHESAVKYSADCRRRSFVWGGILSGLTLGVLIVIAIAAKFGVGAWVTGIIASLLMFPFLSCLFLKNNFIGEMVGTIYGWGFVRFPGLIFTLNLEGIVWLLTVKLLFWIIGFILAAIAGVFAIALGLVVSLFVYPFALKKSFDNPEATDMI